MFTFKNNLKKCFFKKKNPPTKHWVQIKNKSILKIKIVNMLVKLQYCKNTVCYHKVNKNLHDFNSVCKITS